MTKKLLVTGLALVLMAGFAQAATLNVQANVTAAYDSLWNVVTLPDINTNVGTPLIYQVDYSFTIADLIAGQQGFGNMAMNLSLNGVADQLGWSGDSSTFKVGPTNTPIWSDNGDYGVVGDLQGVVVGISGFNTANAVDPRPTLGQDGDVRYVGSVYVLWDGVTPASVDATVTGFSTISTAGQLASDAGTAFATSVTFGAIPEPATMSLLALGGLAALIRRRK